MMSAITTNLDAALSLAAAGFSVFPCHSGGGADKIKKPMPFIKWRQVSTSDERQIRQWWQKWPTAAPALDLAKSGLIVIDCDRHDPLADGIAAFGQLAADHKHDIDVSPLVATPNDGSHVYFRQPAGKSLGNGEGALPDGINVRGSGGYVIAPGAIMEDGRFYELYGNLADAPELPAWLCGIIEARKTASSSISPQLQTGAGTNEIEALLDHIPADLGYHDWVQVLMAIHAATDGAGFAIADRWSARGGAKYCGTKELEKKWRSFKRSGVTSRTLAQIARDHGADLAEIASRFNLPSFDDVEAAAAARLLIESHDGKLTDPETGKVVDLPEEIDEELGGAATYADLPDNALSPPGLVGEIVDWICETTSEPIRVHAVGAALVVVGTVLARKVFTETRPCGTHLYIGATAPSGWGKDHAQNCIKLLLDSVAGSGNPMHVPWASSAPSIGLNLIDRAACVMIADEFAEKFASTRNKNASVSTSAINEVFKELWGRSQGSYAMPSTVSRKAPAIQWPAMSFFGAATIKDFKESLVSKDVTSGLYNRFIFLPRFGEVMAKGDPSGILEPPERIIQRLRWLHDCLDPLQVSQAIRGDGRPGTPLLVPFSAEASRMNEENKAMQKKMQIASDRDDALSLYGRYAEQIKRVALIVACGRHVEAPKRAVIEALDMEFAQRLVQWSTEIAVMMVRHDMVENWIDANRSKVLGYIRQRRKVTKSELLRKVRSIRGDDLDKIIRYLEEAECIDIFRTPTKGRAAVIYEYKRG